MAVSSKNRSVYFAVFTPAMQTLLKALWDLEKQHSYGLVITSANDGVHKTNSKHYTNEALDVRTHNLKNPELVQVQLQKLLGPAFTVLYEYAGTANAHLHLQVKAGTTYVG